MLSTAASACFSPVGSNIILSLAVGKFTAAKPCEHVGYTAGQVDGGACEITQQMDGYLHGVGDMQIPMGNARCIHKKDAVGAILLQPGMDTALHPGVSSAVSNIHRES